LRNKDASLGENFIVTMIILIVSFLLILATIKTMVARADDISGELICRGSVAARSKYYIGTTGEKVSMTPLLCKTKDKEVPVSTKDTSKAAVEKDMGDLVKRCWWQFGNGLVDNIFDDVLFGNEKCFVCYVVTIDKLDSPLSNGDFRTFLSQTSITPTQEDKQTGDIKTIKDVSKYTYMTYVQNSGGSGNIVIIPESFNVNQKYAIAMVSPKFLTPWDKYKTMFQKAFTDPKADYMAYNYILVDEYTDMQNKCEMVSDVTDS